MEVQAVGTKMFIVQSQCDFDVAAPYAAQRVDDVRIAEDKIGRAEAQAMDEVRAAAVDVAIAAADKLISDNLTDSTSGQMIDKTIKELQSKLN